MCVCLFVYVCVFLPSFVKVQHQCLRKFFPIILSKGIPLVPSGMEQVTQVAEESKASLSFMSVCSGK